MSKPYNKKARPMGEILAEGMEVRATAPPVDPDDASDLISAGERDGDYDEQEQAMVPAEPDLTSRLTEALEKLASRESSSTDPVVLGILSTLTAAVDRLAAGQIEGARMVAQATKKAQRPSNEAPPLISTLNPRGDKDFPKPPLKCEMYIPWPAEHESLDREEIELLNLIEPGDYIVIRNDRTKIKMQVRAQYNLDSDAPSRIIMTHDTAFNNDYHRMMPPLSEMLRGMLKQNPKTRKLLDSVVSMEEELACIAAGQLNDGSVPKTGLVISVGE